MDCIAAEGRKVHPLSLSSKLRTPRYLHVKKKIVEEVVASSVTKQEIAFYWKKKRMVEEDHLYAAIKAAARVRARNLTNADYVQFERSLKEGDENKENEVSTTKGSGEKDGIRVGIKDWWTKSKYAYLNEPAVKLFDKPRRSCNYAPQFSCYKSATPPTLTCGYSRQPSYYVK